LFLKGYWKKCMC